jgi:hypothetical protein
MLLQDSTCAAMRDALLLYQFTNIYNKNEAVLSLVVYAHSDFRLTQLIPSTAVAILPYY